MLEIKSKIERELLTYFFLNQKASHHLNELARVLEVDPANLDKKLKELIKSGLFKFKNQGNQKIYSLNPSFPLFKEYQNIIKKMYGIDEILKEKLKELKGIKKAYLFGSYANENFDEFSDIDLLIIGDQDSLDLSEILSELEKKIKREINVVEYSEDDYSERLNTPFIKNIFSKKTIQLI